MAKHVVKTPQIEVNGVNLSAHLTDVSLTYVADEVESTARDDRERQSFIAGLRSWSVDASLRRTTRREVTPPCRNWWCDPFTSRYARPLR
jgi:hypothetical protein